MHGSVLLDKTSLVQDFQIKNLWWFRIIGQNHSRFSITRQNSLGSAFLEGEHFMVPYHQTEPFRFRIVRQRTFCGLALRGQNLSWFSITGTEPFMVQHYGGRTLHGLALRGQNPSWFSIIGQNLSWFNIIGQNLSGFSIVIQNYKAVPQVLQN